MSSNLHANKIKWKALETELTSLLKINSKWLRDLNVNHKTTELLEDCTGENLDDLGYVMDF